MPRTSLSTNLISTCHGSCRAFCVRRCYFVPHRPRARATRGAPHMTFHDFAVKRLRMMSNQLHEPRDHRRQINGHEHAARWPYIRRRPPCLRSALRAAVQNSWNGRPVRIRSPLDNSRARFACAAGDVAPPIQPLPRGRAIHPISQRHVDRTFSIVRESNWCRSIV